MVVISPVTAVFVRGFDFGTTKDQLESHCCEVGTVENVAMQKGSAVVTFSSSSEANAAVAMLNKSTIDGNSRFIDVALDKHSLPPTSGGKRSASILAGSRVFVRGFDFGTTDEQFEAHMSSVGIIENVKWVTKGSAEVTYTSAEEAACAVEELQKTTIEGNSRFIDVMLCKDDEGERPAKRFNSGAAAQWGQDLSPLTPIHGGKIQSLLAAMLGGGKAKGKGLYAMLGGGKAWGKGVGGGKAKGKGRGGADCSDEDPVGSGRVFVRGFDFGTDDAHFEGHMATAGPIHAVHWVTKGSAVVVYERKASAIKAVSKLNQTTIEGNSRYIDIILKE